MGPDNSPPQIVPLNSNNKKGPDIRTTSGTRHQKYYQQSIIFRRPLYCPKSRGAGTAVRVRTERWSERRLHGRAARHRAEKRDATDASGSDIRSFLKNQRQQLAASDVIITIDVIVLLRHDHVVFKR